MTLHARIRSSRVQVLSVLLVACDHGEADSGGASRVGAVGRELGSAAHRTASFDETKIVASDGATDDTFGFAVSMAGDIDGDGFDDLVVGAYGDDDGAERSGSVYVYYGASTGVDATREDKITASDGAEEDWFGRFLSGAGDVDGDGYADVVAGAHRNDELAEDAGAAYVYFGGSTGIDVSREVKLTAPGASSGDGFGEVSGAGDVDADGFADLIVGAAYRDEEQGAAYVFYGSASGVDPGRVESLVASDGGSGDYYGYDVAALGDVDGDGHGDVGVGAMDAY